ncbi:actin interacting protein 3-domain-containing protein [Terfezia claveryi]|nr:actin interacting protein 3-domain-containing protein [Terfezia claveryi]
MSGSSHTSSSASSRNPAHRRQVNLSTIEKSVTHLLIATKQLLETLTAWSRGNATEAQVSDVYVRLGSEFNIACRAFTAIGVETADLGNVPDALRTILESTLSQDASAASLDVYLPRIREIIINLLHGLKRKQSRLRQRQARENGDSSGSQRSSAGPPRVRSNESLEDQITPPRSSSLPISNRGGSLQGPPYPTSRGSTTSSQTHQSTASNIPSISTVSPVSPHPTDTNAIQAAISPQYFTIPPPPEPKDDPLTALQQSNALPRRASRRYSNYLGGKLGASPNGYSLPTSRYRESHDAIDTGRVRQPGGSRPGRNDTSPMKKHRISEEREGDTGLKSPETPHPKSPEERAQLSPPRDTELGRQPSLKVDTVGPPVPPPLVEQLADLQRPHDECQPKTPVPQDISDAAETLRPGTATSQSSNTKEITVFLQIGRSTKKTVLPEGVDDLSLTSLRLLFISKFNYNPPAGEDFPDIYLQDPASGVRYELEDLQDIKDRSVLCLNVEVLDEVKRHIDDGIGGLRNLVEGVKGLVDGQAAALQRVAERQEDAAKKIAELSVTTTVPPAPPTTSASPTNTPEMPPVDHSQQIKEIRDLRKDLAVLRQVYSSFVSDVNNSMTTIKAKAATVKSTAENASTIAAFKAAPGSGRAHVEEGKKTLGTDADNLVTRVDDLQDLVEELRKDVVQRGVRPLHRQLETVSKDLIQAKQELKRMSDYIKREKPKWKKVWERELEVVCDDQQFFNMQEELVSDLQDDLEKASQTFALVEQCTEQQVKASGARSASRGFQPTIDETIDVASVKGNVLNEVRALRPNHENRLEAIERAERLRQKELEGRVPEFKKELGKFVEEGKLKKAGGVEEAERLRKARDEQILKETWEAKKNGILRTAETVSDEKKEELATPDPAADSASVADAEPPVAVTAST